MADVYLYEHCKTLPSDQWERPGKPEWASFLTVTFQDRYRAWELVNTLILQLRNEETSAPDEPFRLMLCGELRKVEE